MYKSINLEIIQNLPYSDLKIQTRINPDNLSRHMAIIAQSGSGKSFFLGRLIEEIVLKTQAKILIFDANSDFIRFHQMNKSIWNEESFKEYIAENDTIESFEENWKKLQYLILSNRKLEFKTYHLKLNFGKMELAEKASLLNIDIKNDYNLFAALEIAFSALTSSFKK